MDKMFVRVPVAIKAKVTEDLKLKIIGDVQNTISSTSNSKPKKLFLRPPAT